MEASHHLGGPDLWGVFGQKSTLRVIDSTSPADLRRMAEIEEYPNADYIFGVERRSTDLIRRWLARKEGMVFGVCNPYAIDGDRSLQGWVSVEEGRSQGQLIEINRLSPKPIVSAIELMYIKHPDAPGGLISSAVRQACIALLQQRSDPFSSHIDPNEFMPPIFLQIDHSNQASQQLAKSAGFQEVTDTVVLPNGGVNVLYSIYLLNWSILNSVLHRSCDKLLFNPQDIPNRISVNQK